MAEQQPTQAAAKIERAPKRHGRMGRIAQCACKAHGPEQPSCFAGRTDFVDIPAHTLPCG